MRIAHLTASGFFGGPERQMLGLAHALQRSVETDFLLFPESGRHRAFRSVIRSDGFPVATLDHDAPHVRRAADELAGLIGERGIDVVFCHGYKANLVGRWAARQAGIPAVAVSRGWTGENLKVRAYEALDRFLLPKMDRVIAVSEGQGAKVKACGVPAERMRVIRNAARSDAFLEADPDARRELLGHFADSGPATRLIVAAGRLSPEKGFGVLVEATRCLRPHCPNARVLIFGEGNLHSSLERQIARAGLRGVVALGGFRDDLDRLLPSADIVTLPSYTEGLPNVALEACAAGVPVVATAVGGTPEVVRDGQSGLLVPAGNPGALAAKLAELVNDPWRCRQLGQGGRSYVRERFTFAAQARAYMELLEAVVPRPAFAPVRMAA